jgi:hypothetical protein
MTLQNRAHSLMGLLVVGGGILYNFPPQVHHFYPPCPFYAATHLLCPGCGGTRAFYQLLHLNFAQAFHWNALVTLCVPIFLAWFFFWYYSVIRYDRTPGIKLPRGAVIVVYATVIVFVVVRNAGMGFAI